MKFLENILSNNGTDDHCTEFISLGGLSPLLGLLNLANMPLEFPLLPACQSLAAVCKSIVVSACFQWFYIDSIIAIIVLATIVYVVACLFHP